MRLSAAAWGELPLEKAQESLPSQATASAGVCAAGHHKVYPDMQVAKRARERSPEAGLLDALPHKKSLWRVHSGAAALLRGWTLPLWVKLGRVCLQGPVKYSCPVCVLSGTTNQMPTHGATGRICALMRRSTGAQELHNVRSCGFCLEMSLCGAGCLFQIVQFRVDLGMSPVSICAASWLCQCGA